MKWWGYWCIRLAMAEGTRWWWVAMVQEMRWGGGWDIVWPGGKTQGGGGLLGKVTGMFVQPRQGI